MGSVGGVEKPKGVSESSKIQADQGVSQDTITDAGSIVLKGWVSMLQAKGKNPTGTGKRVFFNDVMDQLEKAAEKEAPGIGAHALGKKYFPKEVAAYDRLKRAQEAEKKGAEEKRMQEAIRRGAEALIAASRPNPAAAIAHNAARFSSTAPQVAIQIPQGVPTVSVAEEVEEANRLAEELMKEQTGVLDQEPAKSAIVKREAGETGDSRESFIGATVRLESPYQQDEESGRVEKRSFEYSVLMEEGSWEYHIGETIDGGVEIPRPDMKIDVITQSSDSGKRHAFRIQYDHESGRLNAWRLRSNEKGGRSYVPLSDKEVKTFKAYATSSQVRTRFFLPISKTLKQFNAGADELHFRPIESTAEGRKIMDMQEDESGQAMKTTF